VKVALIFIAATLLGQAHLGLATENVGIHTQGTDAKATFLALKISEQEVLIPGKSPERQIFKIGKNILCVETLRESKKTYFCSLAVNAEGEAEELP